MAWEQRLMGHWFYSPRQPFMLKGCKLALIMCYSANTSPLLIYDVQSLIPNSQFSKYWMSPRWILSMWSWTSHTVFLCLFTSSGDITVNEQNSTVRWCHGGCRTVSPQKANPPERCRKAFWTFLQILFFLCDDGFLALQHRTSFPMIPFFFAF